jgi:alpha/beta superfamily hydrolase
MTAKPAAATRLIETFIDGPAGPLEALLQEQDPGAGAEVAPVRIAALVCHPHPLHGGTMHNKVVHRAASALHGLGAAVLRFNFRGAGKSAGEHDEGRGELEDARAALRFLAARHPEARLWVAGFSFGSWIAARLAASETSIEQLILIAPPLHRSDFELLETLTTPKFVIQGTGDELCPIDQLERAYPRWAEPKQLVLIQGASHFFDRLLTQMGEEMTRALAPAARKEMP